MDGSSRHHTHQLRSACITMVWLWARTLCGPRVCNPDRARFSPATAEPKSPLAAIFAAIAEARSKAVQALFQKEWHTDEFTSWSESSQTPDISSASKVQSLMLHPTNSQVKNIISEHLFAGVSGLPPVTASFHSVRGQSAQHISVHEHISKRRSPN